MLMRILCNALITAVTLAAVLTAADAADSPTVVAIIDRDSGAVLWSSANPMSAPTLKPGQEILIRGQNLGPGPITAARP
jgi:hypothetical protein